MFTSASNDNGAAFGGLSGNTDWFNTKLGRCMLGGRFLLSVPVLALAGSSARKQYRPGHRRHDAHGNAALRRLALGIVLVVVGLTYVPVL